MDEHEDLRQRLRALGTQPIEPSLQSTHLTMLSAAGRRSLRPKLRTAGVFLAGLLVGGSGLAVAGALPDPAQHVAHQAFGEVGVQVPDPERYHGPECGPDVKRNHGAYVRDDKGVARTECGKPVGGDKDELKGEEEEEEGGEPGAERAAKGPCQGPPPWGGANKSSMTTDEKAAAQAARALECGEGGKAPEAAASTTTTASTTTLPPAETPTTLSETTTTAAG